MDEALFLTIYANVLVFVIGACIGSFLNVVIYRLPAGKSVVTPRSQCSCGTFIAWYDNIPILSWFILRGRCRHCKAPFSIRYPMVELGTALVFIGLWNTGDWPESIAWISFAGLMIPASFIDLDTMEIPDVFSIGGCLAGLVFSVVVPSIHGVESSGLFVVDAVKGAIPALQGAFIGSGLILWVALFAEVILRKEAMGFGDVKLMGAIGAFCGWQGAVFAFFGGSVLGCVALVIAYPFLRKSGNGLKRIPFGPALAGGALLYLLMARPFVSAYFDNFAELLRSI